MQESTFADLNCDMNRRVGDVDVLDNLHFALSNRYVNATLAIPPTIGRSQWSAKNREHKDRGNKAKHGQSGPETTRHRFTIKVPCLPIIMKTAEAGSHSSYSS